MTLWEVAGELSRRMTSIFLHDEKGRRPVFGNLEKFQTDPQWRDLVLFHEYFHGDSGAGIGASDQTLDGRSHQVNATERRVPRPEENRTGGCNCSRRLNL